MNGPLSWRSSLTGVVLALCGITGYLAMDRYVLREPAPAPALALALADPAPAPAPATASAAQAVLTLLGGAPVPEQLEPGGVLVLSSEKSRAGAATSAVRWEVTPESAQKAAVILPGGRQLTLAAGVAPTTITVRLYVARDGSIDGLSRAIRVGKPGPTPTPTPVDPVDDAPAVATDPAVREAAAAYFAAFVAMYREVPGKLAGASPLYNEVTQAQLAVRKVRGEALGQAIDRLTLPLLDEQNQFRDRAQAGQVYATIANSLAASLKDASKKAP